MKKRILSLLLALCLAVSLLPGVALFAQAAQAPDDVTYIYDQAGLEAIDDTAAALGKHYILMNDITLTGAWNPIGYDFLSQTTASFTGTLEGNGHVVSGISIAGDFIYAGLFAQIGAAGVVRDLTVNGSINVSRTTSNVSGDSVYVGGIAALNGGELINCRNDAQVLAQNIASYTTSSSEEVRVYAGGIAGINSGKLRGCVSAGYVSADVYITVPGGDTSSRAVAYASGLAGRAESSSLILNCTCLATLSAGGRASNGNLTNHPGCMAGERAAGAVIENCCYGAADPVGSGTNCTQPTSAAEANSAIIAGNKLSTHSLWRDNNGTLELCDTWIEAYDARYPEGLDISDGYIDNVWELAALAKAVNNGTIDAVRPNGAFMLTADIDMDLGNSQYYWTPIGVIDWTPTEIVKNSFIGSFDGKGHTISNMYVNDRREIAALAGLFGYAEGAYIDSVTVESGFATSGVGENRDGLIANAMSGGIVAYFESGTVINCANTGVEVSADMLSDDGFVAAGGVAGEASERALLANCYNRAPVSGSTAAGGVVAYLIGNAKADNCYSTGVITGKRKDSGSSYTNIYEDANINADLLRKLNATVASGLNDNTYKYWKTDAAVNDGLPVFCESWAEALAAKKAALGEDFEIFADNVITDEWELAQFADEVTGGDLKTGETYYLAADLDLGLYPWTPIGSHAGTHGGGTNGFGGAFEGDWHTVSNLYVRVDESSNTSKRYCDAGLFAYARPGSLIKNLGVVDGYVTGDGYIPGLGQFDADANVGGVVGYNRGKLLNLWSTGDKFTGYVSAYGSSDKLIGGITGVSESEVYNCWSTIGMDAASGAKTFVGGIAGKTTESSVIKNCWINLPGESAIPIADTATGLVENSYSPDNLGAASTEADYLEALNYYVYASGEDMSLLRCWQIVPGVNEGWPVHYETWDAAVAEIERRDGGPRDIETGYLGDAWDFAAFAAAVNAGEIGDIKENGYFMLTEDIDLELYRWTPIDDFDGHFNGKAQQITNMAVREDGNYAGLFASLGEDAEVWSVELTGISVAHGSGTPAGGLAGVNYGLIRNCRVQGAVAATAQADTEASAIAGGLVCGNSGVIRDSFTTELTVKTLSSGYAYSGGFVSDNEGTIENSYASALAIARADSKRRFAVGLACSSEGTILNAYWNTDLTKNAFGVVAADNCYAFDFDGELAQAVTVYGGTYDNLPDALNAFTAYWDNDETLKYWMTDEDDNGGLPVFCDYWDEALLPRLDFFPEDGDISNCVLNNEWELTQLANEVNDGESKGGETYYLTEYLDLDLYLWEPIGVNDCLFEGTLEGGWHTIANLYSRVSVGYDYCEAGLFAAVGENALLKNLGIEDGYVTATNDDYLDDDADAGAFAAFSAGKLLNLWNTGDKFPGYVSSFISEDLADNPRRHMNAGGIAGHNTGGTIQNCWSTALVDTRQDIVCDSDPGGIAGWNEANWFDGTPGRIENCWSNPWGEGRSPYSAIVRDECVAANLCNVETEKASGTAPADMLAALNAYIDANDANGSLRYWQIIDGVNEGWPVFYETWTDAVEFKGGEDISNGSIETPWELAELALEVNGGDDKYTKTFTILSDLDLELYRWEPIASDESLAFKGTLRGREHELETYTIKNIAVNETAVGENENALAGLFGYVDRVGTVDFLYLEGTVAAHVLKGGTAYAGGFAGISAGELISCYNYAAVTADGTDVRVQDDASLASCAGGVAGWNRTIEAPSSNKSAVILNCDNYGPVTARRSLETFSGGIVALNKNEDDSSLHSSILKNSYNAGHIEAFGFYDNLAGGAVGVNNPENPAPADSCKVFNFYNIGHIDAFRSLAENAESIEGGAVGKNDGGETQFIYLLDAGSEYYPTSPVGTGTQTPAHLFDIFTAPGSLVRYQGTTTTLMNALNLWVDSRNDETLKRWKVQDGVNQGYPIFGSRPDAEKITVSVTSEGDGTVYPAGTYIVEKGASQSVLITPNEGRAIVSVSVNGQPVPLGSLLIVKDGVWKLELTNILANTTVHVTFTKADAPTTPETPVTPPETPVTPDAPETPETPETPEKPAEPVTPVQPEDETDKSVLRVNRRGTYYTVEAQTLGAGKNASSVETVRRGGHADFTLTPDKASLLRALYINGVNVIKDCTFYNGVWSYTKSEITENITALAVFATPYSWLPACTGAYLGKAINTYEFTDIVTLINGEKITSYNIDGYTCVVAEDLREYGFWVVYDNAARTLRLVRNHDAEITGGNYVKPEGGTIGAKAGDVLCTDIVTSLGRENVVVKSYNIDGQTCIDTEYLKAFCTAYSYDNATRTLRLTLAG